jgi:hypothetical protein
MRFRSTREMVLVLAASRPIGLVNAHRAYRLPLVTASVGVAGLSESVIPPRSPLL